MGRADFRPAGFPQFPAFHETPSHRLDPAPISIAQLPSRHFMWNLFVLLIVWAVVANTLIGRQAGRTRGDRRAGSATPESGRSRGRLALTRSSSDASCCSPSAPGERCLRGGSRHWLLANLPHRPADRANAGGAHRTHLVATLRARSSMTEFFVRNRHPPVAPRAAEMTQAELARLCGVTRQTIIALEAGKYSPSLELAFKLARALGRNFDEVFQYDEKKNSFARTNSRRLARDLRLE